MTDVRRPPRSVSAGPPNKPLEQTNGALARMEAPFAAQRQRSADKAGAMTNLRLWRIE